MKKLIFAFILINLLGVLKVNAQVLGTPNSYAYFNDDSMVGPSNASIVGWWGTNNYYRSPYLMGGVSSSSYIKRVDFNWNNANLCSNNDISITGTIGGLSDLFTEQSTSIIAFNNGQEMACSTTMENSSRMKFQCYGKGGGTLSIYVFQNSYSLVKQYEIAVSRDMTISCDASNLDIISNASQNTQNIINNQNSNTNQIIQDNQQNTQDIIDNQQQNTQDIIDNQQQNTQDIIDNQQQNTQDIIDNQQQNTQDIIDNQQQNTQDIINNQNQNTQQEIESQQVCNFYDISSATILNSYINPSNGSIISSTSSNVTDFIPISSFDKLELLNPMSGYLYNAYAFYNINKTFISGSATNNLSSGFITIPTNASYVRFTINISNNQPQYNLCKNGNQALNDSVNNLNDSITSEDNPNTNQDINDMNNMVASDTPISDLITMPLTLINAYINGVNSSCSPINLGNLYGTNLVLPCINLEQRLGSNLWSIIDAFFSIFMCYNIGMLFITAFDGITSLRDDFEGLYQPRHADTGYQPKHGG